MRVRIQKKSEVQCISKLPMSLLKNPPEEVAIDTECTGLHWSGNDKLFGIGLVFDQDSKRHKYYTEFSVDGKSREPKYDLTGFNIFNNAILTNPSVKKIFANGKYDWHMIANSFSHVFELVGPIEDVLLAAWYCNTLEPSYKLETLASKYLDASREDVDRLRECVQQLRPTAKKEGLQAGAEITKWQQDYWLPKYYNIKPNLCEEYCLEDVGNTLDLWYFYKAGLKELGVEEHYNKGIQLMRILYQMEKRGVRFFEEECLEELDLLSGKINEIFAEIQTIVFDVLGEIINLNSPKQLVKLLYTDAGYGLPINRTTEKGEPSTDTKTLQQLKEHPKTIISGADKFIDLFFQYRGFEKGKSFCKNYSKYAVQDNSVTLSDLTWLHQKKAIHTTFNQLFSAQDKENKTRTGRLSSSDPNLHNVADPSKSKGVFVTDARRFFGPREGYYWYCIDYSQQDLRNFAERLGSESTLYKAFASGEDPHQMMADSVPYLVELGKENPKFARQLGKHTNFTVINTGGKYALYKQYNIPLEQGEQLIRGFYQTEPLARKRQKEAEHFAIKHGYIETLFGRRIHVKLDQDRDTGDYLWAYQATAYDVQGTTQDLIAEAMRQIQSWFLTLELDCHMVLQVHDELVFEIRKEHCFKWLLRGIKERMENAGEGIFTLPLNCEIERTKDSWSSKDKKEVNL